MNYNALQMPAVSGYIFKRDAFQKAFIQTNNDEVCITKISKNLSLRQPIIIPFQKEDNYYIMGYSVGNLVLEAVSETYCGMVQDFKYQLADAWDYYANEDDNKLTRGAIKVKKWLQDHVVEGK